MARDQAHIVGPVRHWVLAAVVIALAATACNTSSSEETRSVLADYDHDEFVTSMIGFFPETVTVHAGDTVRFRQAWTGEAHSVTFGTLFNDALGRIRARLARSPRPSADEVAGDLDLLSRLPAILGGTNEEFRVNQNGAQPCFLETGAPPTDPDTRCPRREQPRFTGRHAYYSSGFIPFEGEDGNQFDLPLSDDIDPGDYHFYCTLHGPGQSGTVRVVPKGEPIPSQSDVDRAARTVILDQFVRPLEAALRAARPQPLVGVDAPPGIRTWGGLVHQRHLEHAHGSVNEFIPESVRTTVGSEVTWTLTGRHTISFNVPRYFPIFEVDPDGAVTLDPRAHMPVGWPGRPPTTDSAPVHVRAGPWDGRGFHSSGLDWRDGDRFSVTFTAPGTYKMACLIHPAMVGEVVVAA